MYIIFNLQDGSVPRSAWPPPATLILAAGGPQRLAGIFNLLTQGCILYFGAHSDLRQITLGSSAKIRTYNVRRVCMSYYCIRNNPALAIAA